MTFSGFRNHTNPLFIKLKVLKVSEIIKLQQLKVYYEFLDNSLPADLKEMFEGISIVIKLDSPFIFLQSIHQLIGSIQLDILFLNYIMIHSRITVLLLTKV